MPHVDYDSLISPVADDDPCGPDLDLAFDPGYMNFMASAEGLLPSSYFVKDQNGNERPFDRTAVDLKAQFEAAKPFLEKTRDLRLLALLAKFAILDRDLDGFIACIRAISTLVAERWDEVHPRAEDGDFTTRMAALESIDVLPTVVMPLQFQPLIEHRRYGPVSYRGFMIATAEVTPREGEEPVQVANIDKALDETDLAMLVERRAQLSGLNAALTRIPQTWQEKSGSDSAVSLEKLQTAVGKMVTLLDKAVAKRDPSAALDAGDQPVGEGDAAGTQGAGPVAVGRITSVIDAAAALAAAADYFRKFEPSSPALLLARQAKELVGKSFLEVMRVLVPNEVERAMVNIGGDQFFDLPIERLSPFSPDWKPPEATESQDQSGWSGSSESSSSWDSSESTESTESQASALAPEPAAGSELQEHPGNGAAAATRIFEARSRSEALALLDVAGSYFRLAEPTSPIPFLTERARDLAQRDFLSVLKALLPPDSLKSNAPGS